MEVWLKIQWNAPGPGIIPLLSFAIPGCGTDDEVISVLYERYLAGSAGFVVTLPQPDYNSWPYPVGVPDYGHAFTDGGWHHLAVLMHIDGWMGDGNRGVSVYTDGIPQGSAFDQNLGWPPCASALGSLALGQRHSAFNTLHNGSTQNGKVFMTEFRLWNRELVLSEIAASFNQRWRPTLSVR